MSTFKFLVLSVVMAALVSVSVYAQTPAGAPADAPKRVSAADQTKLLTKSVKPVYPKDLYEAKVTGIISLETTIGPDGKVTNVRLLGTGNEALVKAAEDAVKQWVYKPTKVAGKPISVVTIVTVNFKVGE